jgi:hypothetical protein
MVEREQADQYGGGRLVRVYASDDGQEVELDERVVRRYLEAKRRREQQQLWAPDRLFAYSDRTAWTAIRNLEPWLTEKKKADALREQNAGQTPLETHH